MELLTCPACGCSVQVADAVLGRRVRCFGCQHSFIAAAPQAAQPSARRPPPPRFVDLPQRDDEDESPSGRGPFCPGCGRRIGWRDAYCSHCGEELEPESGPRSALDLIRRDYEPHRGPLILSLGNISMIVGGLALCMFGFGAVISVPIGIVAWLMANRDLERMREGRMDPSGKSQTQTGRTGAVAGVILGLIFAAFFALVYLVG